MYLGKGEEAGLVRGKWSDKCPNDFAVTQTGILALTF